jgi:hypothetical protein
MSARFRIYAAPKNASRKPRLVDRQQDFWIGLDRAKRLAAARPDDHILMLLRRRRETLVWCCLPDDVVAGDIPAAAAPLEGPLLRARHGRRPADTEATP